MALSLAEAKSFLQTVRYPGCSIAEQEEYIQAHLTRILDLFHTIEAKALTAEHTVVDVGAKPYMLAALVKKFSAAKFIGVGYSIEEVRDVQRQVSAAEKRSSLGSTGDVEIKSAMIPLSTEAVLPTDDRRQTIDAFPMWQCNVETSPLPLPDNSADVVVFSEILEHLLFNPALVLAEMNRILKPGGTFILSTPDQLYWVRIAKMLLGKNIDDPYSIHGPYGRHNRNYTVKELNSLGEAQGFKLHHWTTKTFLPLSASGMQKLLVNAGHLIFTLLPSRRGKTYVGVFEKVSHEPTPKYPNWLYH